MNICCKHLEWDYQFFDESVINSVTPTISSFKSTQEVDFLGRCKIYKY